LGVSGTGRGNAAQRLGVIKKEVFNTNIQWQLIHLQLGEK
jgi:hypothetical protein